MADEINELLDTTIIPNGDVRFAVESSFGLNSPWGPLAAPVDVPAEQGSLAGNALQRGMYTVGADYANVAGMIAQGVGFDQVAEGIYAKSREWEHAAEALPRRIARIEDVQSMGDFGTWAVESLIETAPMLASIAIPGGIGLKIGTKAATAAAFISDLGLQTGESVRVAREAGKDPTDIRVIGSGIGKAVLDFLPIVSVASRMGLGPMADTFLAKFLTDGGYIKRVAGSAATILATEVPTEVAQEGINIWLGRALRGQFGELNDEEKSQLLNAGAGAAALGLLSPVLGMQRRQQQMNEDLGGAPPATAEASEENLARTQVMGTANEKAVPQDRKKPSTMATPKAARWQEEGLYTFLDLDEGRTEADGVPRYRAVVVDRGDDRQPLFEVYDGNGVKIAETMDKTEAKGIAIGMSDDQASVKMFYSTDYQGGQLVSQSDTMKTAADAVKSNGGPKGMADVATVVIDQGRKTATMKQAKPVIPGRPQPDTPYTPIQKQVETILSAESNYRTTDGALKNEAAAQIKGLEARADVISKRTGTPNPLKDSIPVGNDAEGALEQAETPAMDINQVPNLTETERLEYAKLMEREAVEGLSPAGYEKLEALVSKVRGEETTRRVPIRFKDTPEYLEAIRIIDKETRAMEKAARPRKRPKSAQRTGEARWVQRGKNYGLVHNGEVIGGVVSHEQDGQTYYVPRWKEGGKWSVDEFGYPTLKQATDWLEGQLAVNEVSLEQALTAITALSKELRYGPQVVLVSKRDPNLERDHPLAAMQSEAKGFYPFSAKLTKDQMLAWKTNGDGKSVYIIYDNHKSVKDVVRTYLHETLAHFGLRAFYTEGELRVMFKDIQDSRRLEIGKHRLARQGIKFYDQEELAGAMDSVNTLDVEEYIAKIAEDGTDQSLLSRAIAWVRKAIRAIGGKLEWTDADITYMLRGIRRYLTTGVTNGYRGSFDALTDVEVMRRLTGLGDEDIEVIRTGSRKLWDVWGAKFGNLFLSPMQIAEQFGKGVANGYMELVQRWWGEKRTLTEPSLEIAKEWSSIGKDNGQRLSHALVDISLKSDKEGRALTAEEKAKLYDERGVNGSLRDMAERIFADFRRAANLLEENLLKGEIQRATRDVAATETLYKAFVSDPNKFTDVVVAHESLEVLNLPGRLDAIVSQMRILKDRDYFPRMRFGKYALTVRAKEGGATIDGQKHKAGSVIEFATFDTLDERSQALDQVKTSYKGANASVQVSILKDEEFDLLGMPPALHDTLRETLNLSPQQQLLLTDLYYKHSPGKAFLRHLLRRKNTKGFSMDALRTYTAYMMKAANHVARAKYATPLSQELQRISAWAKGETDADRASMVSEYFNKHMQYILTPENDWAGLRSFGFMWHLGFNVKSALVNLTQIPMVAQNYLGAQYGDGKAAAALLKATKLVVQARTGKVYRNAALAEDVKKGIMQSFLDESQASELAGYAEGDVLHRLVPFSPSLTTYNRFAYYGSWLFRNAEVLNREITFAAAWMLARDKGASTVGANEYELSEAGLAGREAVQSAMFEYARWNRPQFMRGKKSVFFLFWNYMQNMAYLSFGGKGGKVALRVWLSLLMAAGVQGLPFAENIMDLFDLLGTQIKEALGLPDPKVSIRQDIRSLAKVLVDDPDIVMHGLGRYYGLGAAHLFGAPNFDISGSLSAGRPIPGMDVLAREYRNPDEQFGRLMVEALGPVMAIPYNFWKAMESDDPDRWKVWERAMPAVIAQSSKAIRRETHDAELLRGAAPLVRFDPNDLSARLENIGQAFGFTPTRLAKAFERNAVQADMVTYWKVRRAMVIENMAFAILAEDQDAVADARRSVDEFNKQAPAPGLRIRGDTISDSLKTRIRRRSLRDQGLPPEKAFVPLYSQLEPLYPQAEQ